VSKTTAKTLSALSLVTLVALESFTTPAQAVNFGNMMNPNRWMGGRDRYYDDGPWGGPWGGGYGNPWGGGYGAPWGGPYGGPGYGYGYPTPGYGNGAPGYPGTPAAAGPLSAPRQGSAATQEEVEALKRRIQELEAAQTPRGPAVPADTWPAAPTYRPLNQQ